MWIDVCVCWVAVKVQEKRMERENKSIKSGKDDEKVVFVPVTPVFPNTLFLLSIHSIQSTSFQEGLEITGE